MYVPEISARFSASLVNEKLNHKSCEAQSVTFARAPVHNLELRHALLVAHRASPRARAHTPMDRSSNAAWLGGVTFRYFFTSKCPNTGTLSLVRLWFSQIAMNVVQTWYVGRGTFQVPSIKMSSLSVAWEIRKPLYTEGVPSACPNSRSMIVARPIS